MDKILEERAKREAREQRLREQAKEVFSYMNQIEEESEELSEFADPYDEDVIDRKKG